MNILIAGASGYIGHGLIHELLNRYPACKVYGLSRNPKESHDPRLEWKSCDLFSLKQLEEAAPNHIDVAYYLVHSMMPTAHLDQGSFADYDLILADNFARVVKKRKPRQVVYLGGLIPTSAEKLSLHLQSRLEVEKVFRDHELPVTTLRAGLIIGAGGSSFQMLLQLIRRLPMLICPRWTLTFTVPIDLKTVLICLGEAISRPDTVGRSFDLAGCQPLSYFEMLKTTADFLGVRRAFIRVPFFSPNFSRLWVSAVTGTPKALVYPLIQSLKHNMTARPDHLYDEAMEKRMATRTYGDLLAELPPQSFETKGSPHFSPDRNTVRSVQRLRHPSNLTATDVKNEYVRWLPVALFPFMLVTLEEDRVIFSILRKNWKFLVLLNSASRSSPDRPLLYILGGLLVAEKNRGRLEFREVLKGKYILAAIHDFRPALPWVLYQWTQAKIHLWVMRAFGRHLERL